MKFLYIIPVILFLVGCGSNYDIITGGGNQCVDGYEPLPTDMEKLDPDNFGRPEQQVSGFDALPAGLYQFNGAEVFFRDTSNNIMIHVRLPAKKDAQGNMVPDTANAVHPVCLAGFEQIRETPYKPRSQKVATAFTVANVGTAGNPVGKVTSLTTQELGYNWNFNGKDHPHDNKLETVIKTPNVDQQASTSTADLANIYSIQKDDPKFDKVRIYCVGPCGPNNNPKQYQIRASRTMTPQKGGDTVFIEVMSSFIVDKNKN